MRGSRLVRVHKRFGCSGSRGTSSDERQGNLLGEFRHASLRQRLAPQYLAAAIHGDQVKEVLCQVDADSCTLHYQILLRFSLTDDRPSHRWANQHCEPVRKTSGGPYHHFGPYRLRCFDNK
jgi:hypothetical protein